MGRVGYDPRKGRLKSDARITIDRFFGAHIQIPATAAVAADGDGVLLANLAVAAQVITAGITNPAVPRALSVDGNVAGVVGNVKITGTNYAGAVIDETIALNETTAVSGTKAFKTITKIELPAQVHTPVAQVETATAAGTVTTTGFGVATVTAAALGDASPLDVAFDVVVGDDASAIALAIRTALAADALIAEHFTVSGATDKVILTAKVPAANDASLNIAIDDGAGEGASAGVSTVAASANTTAGVPYDIVSIGWVDVLGLPYLLAHNTVQAAYLDNVKEANAPTVTISATAIESNTITLNSALAGKVVDIYLIV